MGRHSPRAIRALRADSASPTRTSSFDPSSRLKPYLPLVLFWLIVLTKAWATRWVVIGDLSPLSALALEGGIILAVLALAGLVAGRWRLWAYLTVDALFSIIFVASAVYVAQFEQLPTPDTLALARQLGTVQESVWSLLQVWYALYFVDILLIAVLLVVTARTSSAPPARRDPGLVGIAAAAVVWAGIVLGLVAFGGPIADSQAGARARGMLAFQLASSGSPSEDVAAAAVPRTVEPGAARAVARAKPVDYADPASVQREIDLLQGSLPATRVAGAPLPGAYAGKNVIVIQLEAMMPLLIGTEFSDQEVTPNLNQLVAESWYAPSMFMQMGKGNTSDAEFVSNTSLLARRSQPSSIAWGKKQIPSLPRMLRAQGYPAYTFHANTVSFWRRDLLYPALGFTAYRDKEFYRDEDKIGIGASDEAFYRKTLPVIEGLRKKGPFYAQLVTLSAHHPFRQVSTQTDYPVPEKIRGTTTDRYIKAQHYADRQLGELITQLKANGLWDESVVVIYGDHFGLSLSTMSKAEQKVLSGIVGHDFTSVDQFRVPLLIHLPGQTTPERIDDTIGQVDIMPTILDLLGVDVSRTAMIGRSAFVGGSPIVPLRYYAPEGTFVTDDVLFRPGIGYDDASMRRTSDGTPMPAGSVSRELYDRAITLLAVNESYLSALPSLPATTTIKSR